MIVLCTHHKGGVGKTELAIHVTGILRETTDRILLLDCDSQASSWEFYFGQGPTAEKEVRAVDAKLSVIWNPKRERLESLTAQEEFGHFVIDIDSPLEHTVQAIVQDRPSLILIPISSAQEHEGLVRLGDPLGIIAKLERTIGLRSRVRVIPLGVRVGAIRKRLGELEAVPADCLIVPKVRNLQKETQQARRERRYVWEYPECKDLTEYFRSLLRS